MHSLLTQLLQGSPTTAALHLTLRVRHGAQALLIFGEEAVGGIRGGIGRTLFSICVRELGLLSGKCWLALRGLIEIVDVTETA
jgi:hypothetical protein